MATNSNTMTALQEAVTRFTYFVFIPSAFALGIRRAMNNGNRDNHNSSRIDLKRWAYRVKNIIRVFALA